MTIQNSMKEVYLEKIEAISNEIQNLKDELNMIIEGEAETDINLDISNKSNDIRCNPETLNDSIDTFESNEHIDYIEEKQEDKFVKFYSFDPKFIPEPYRKYGFRIGLVELVGREIQMLVEIYNAEDEFYAGDERLGMIVQTYDIDSADFDDLIRAVYCSERGGFVDVRTKDLTDVFGVIEFKKVGSALLLDWATFCPNQTPYCWIHDYVSEFLTHEMYKN